MSHRTSLALGVAVGVVMLTGCETGSIFSSDQAVTSTRVIADDREALFTAVTIETDRRILIVDERDQTICGEPSPEALETYSAEFADAVGTAVRKGNIDAESATSLVAMFDYAVDGLTPLSQGIKFGRDQLYFLCLSRQNGYISDDQYLTLFNEIITQSARLVALEVPTLRSAGVGEIERTRDFLKTALETSEDLAEAIRDSQDRRAAKDDGEEDD